MDTLTVKVEVPFTANSVIALISHPGDCDAYSSKATSGRLLPAKYEVLATTRHPKDHCHHGTTTWSNSCSMTAGTKSPRVICAKPWPILMDTIPAKVEVPSTANSLIALINNLGDRDGYRSIANSN